ncbi:hypothetical protein OKC48_07695 [Methylorubrum extorquens]|uniref:hypothetical protein n=1 Tax=Methylorubrum extorquens TaxID=408 RepID=UPI0022381F4B|nr:hypothetical protein [Methylorubrum extorquens]UYW28388.1 hypothetical protein OKC48_07695 [Methylorubrum extorquens]
MSQRQLDNIAAMGRAQAGQAKLGRPSTGLYDALTVAVAMEVAFLCGSTRAGERSVGIPGSSLLNHLAQRGLVPPAICLTQRGRNSSDGAWARRGDAEAAARIEARHAHELADAAVLHVALPFVEDQPATGRYVLPPASQALAAMLAGHPPDSVALAFPGLAATPAPCPAEITWEAAVPAPLPQKPWGRPAPKAPAPIEIFAPRPAPPAAVQAVERRPMSWRNAWRFAWPGDRFVARAR